MKSPTRTGEELARSEAVTTLLRLAWEEDVGSGDVTTGLMVDETPAVGAITAREAGVFCGLPILQRIAELRGGAFTCEGLEEGERFCAGDVVVTLRGGAATLLTAERLLLNVLQRLCGVATVTRDHVDAVDGTGCTILETRKTIPGWRTLDKYAVVCGGGANHRMGLYDQVLAKENHFALARVRHAGFAESVAALVRDVPHGVRVEVEVETLDELDAALQPGVDVILLDNMSGDDLREAVRRRDSADVAPLLEASGGITLDTVRDIAATGVDRISVGALTHSVRAVDLSMSLRTS